MGMVFISHHLDEIPRIGDTVSVLRDGKFISQVSADTSEDELVSLMVGRDIDDQFPPPAASETQGEVLLEVEGSQQRGEVLAGRLPRPRGEVLGIAGLVGAGRTEVLRAVFGADPYDTGTVTLQGRGLPAGDVGRSIARGLGLVPEGPQDPGPGAGCGRGRERRLRDPALHRHNGAWPTGAASAPAPRRSPSSSRCGWRARPAHPQPLRRQPAEGRLRPLG